MPRRPFRPKPAAQGRVAVLLVGALALVAASGGVAAFAVRAARPPATPPVAASPAPAATTLPARTAVDRLRASTSGLLTTPHRDVDAAVAAWTQMARDLVAAGDATDPSTASVTMSLELARALATPQGRSAVAATEAALDGRVLTLPDPSGTTSASSASTSTTTASATGRSSASGGTTGAGLVRAGAADPRLHVYYVNGVLNDLVMATQGAYQLAQAFGVHVDLAYDRSVLEVDQYAVDLCMRGIVARYRDREGVADFGDSSLSTLVTEADRNLEAAGDAALTVACSTADAVLSSANLARQKIKDVLASGSQVTMQWLADSRLVSSGVNQDLERRVKGYLRRGDRAVLVGHSQGTMFVRQALKDLQNWWPEAYAAGELDGCDAGEQPSTPVPVGALYISPAFWADDADSADLNSGLQRYVALRGDVLGRLKIGWVQPTAEPDVRQRSIVPAYNAIKLHVLDTYLMTSESPSMSRMQVVGRFEQLTDALADLDPTAECDKESSGATGDPTSTAGDGGATGDPGDGTSWVIWSAVGADAEHQVGINVTTKSDFLQPQAYRKTLLVSQEFDAEDKAMTVLCKGLTNVRMWPLGAGLHGDWKGKTYGLGRVDCPRG